ncbi:reverse transcriptase domain-containing protein [Tanacetum coccineum]|uniref:Reverse transcriptase domain-containing protein n=1 Tax=Tanacetum coccineum TaxID=301880 RepID=A0ABQ5GRC2_9ASTR
MADNRTMAQLLEAPTEGYEDAIIVPEITANNFEIKHGLLNLVQNKQFFGHDKEDPHAHIRYFNKITSTMKFPNVPSTSVKLMLFPFSLEGAARIWLEKEPPRSILTWDDLQCHKRSSITIAWAIVSKVSTSSSTPAVSSDVAELKDMVSALILDKNNQTPAPALVKAVEQSCVTCGGGHSYQNCPATDDNIYCDNIQEYVSQAAAVNYNQGNASYRPQMVANQIRPPGFPPMGNKRRSVIKDDLLASKFFGDFSDIHFEAKRSRTLPAQLLVTGWRVCIDYQKLNDATRKDHFPLPFMDQMLERLAGNEYYCFLDGFSGYFQIPIDPLDQEKTTFTCPYGTFAYRRMPFGLCNAPGTFQRCMVAIFHDMIEKTMEVFMDDFLVFGDSFSSCLSHLDKML